MNFQQNTISLRLKKSDIFLLLCFSYFIVGFLIYYLFIGRGIYISILKNYWGNAGTILFFPLLFFMIIKTGCDYRSITMIDLAFFSILILTFINIVVWYVFNKAAQATMIVRSGFAGIIFNFVLWALAKYTDFYKLKRIFLFMFILISVFAFANILSKSFFLEGNTKIGFNPTYQDFGLAFCILSCIVMTLQKRIIRKGMVFLVAEIILLFNTARTELVVFAIVSLFIFFIHAKEQKRMFRFLVIAMFFLLLVLFIMQNVQGLNFYRVTSLLSIKNDASFLERKVYEKIAIDTIFSSPLTGDYVAYVQETGKLGTYAHNILSAWADLGIAGFFLYIFLIIYSIFYSYKMMIQKAGGELAELSLFLALFVFLAFIFAKTYTYMLFGFMIGACANLYYSINHVNNWRNNVALS